MRQPSRQGIALFSVRMEFWRSTGVLKRKKKTIPLCLASEGIKEARRRFQPILDKINAANLAPSNPQKNIIFKTYADRWKVLWMSKMKLSTQATVAGHVRVLTMHLGDFNLRQIDRMQIQALVDQMGGAAKYNPKTIRNYLITFNLIMKEALEQGYIDAMPSRPKLPKSLKKKARSFSLDEVARTIRGAGDVDDWDNFALYWCAAETGLRLGELCALRLEDVDLEKRCINVQHSLWNGHLGTPKTLSSIRQVMISEPLTYVISLQKEGQEHNHYPNLFSDKVVKGHAIFTDDLRRKQLHPLLKRLNIPRAGFHAFRHFNTALMHELGIEAKVMAERLGHSSTASFLPEGVGAFTLDVYGSTNAKQHRNAADRIGAVIIKAEHSVCLTSTKENGSEVEAPKPLYLN